MNKEQKTKILPRIVSLGDSALEKLFQRASTRLPDQIVYTGEVERGYTSPEGHDAIRGSGRRLKEIQELYYGIHATLYNGGEVAIAPVGKDSELRRVTDYTREITVPVGEEKEQTYGLSDAEYASFVNALTHIDYQFNTQTESKISLKDRLTTDEKIVLVYGG